MARRAASMLSMTNLVYRIVENENEQSVELCTCITSPCPGVRTNDESNTYFVAGACVSESKATAMRCNPTGLEPAAPPQFTAPATHGTPTSFCGYTTTFRAGS